MRVPEYFLPLTKAHKGRSEGVRLPAAKDAASPLETGANVESPGSTLPGLNRKDSLHRGFRSALLCSPHSYSALVPSGQLITFVSGKRLVGQVQFFKAEFLALSETVARHKKSMDFPHLIDCKQRAE